MTVLCARAGFEKAGLCGQIFIAVGIADIGLRVGDRVVGDTQGVGTHVGDQTDRADALELNALVQLLRDLHGAAGLEIELAGRLLL